jgi:hypothetical protein
MSIIHHEHSTYKICLLLIVHWLVHKSIYVTMCIEFGIVFVQLNILFAERQQVQTITSCINKFGPILIHFHLG